MGPVSYFLVVTVPNLRSADLSASAHLAYLCQSRPAQQEDDRAQDGQCDHECHRVCEHNERSQCQQTKTERRRPEQSEPPRVAAIDRHTSENGHQNLTLRTGPGGCCVRPACRHLRRSLNTTLARFPTSSCHSVLR